MDILDLIHPSSEDTYTGVYFDRLPSSYTVFDTSDGAPEDFKDKEKTFFYSYLGERYRQHLYPVPNLADGVNIDAVIRTKAGKGFNVDGYIKLADGRFYSIVTISQDMEKASKRAAKFLPQPVGTVYTIRLTKIDYALDNLGKEKSDAKKVVFTNDQS